MRKRRRRIGAPPARQVVFITFFIFIISMVGSILVVNEALSQFW
ncbi:hypothetical protein [Gracilibacillus sp. JCM 18860]